MTPDDILSLTMVPSEPLGNTERNTLKFVIFVEIEQKTISTIIMLLILYNLYNISDII